MPAPQATKATPNTDTSATSSTNSTTDRGEPSSPPQPPEWDGWALDPAKTTTGHLVQWAGEYRAGQRGVLLRWLRIGRQWAWQRQVNQKQIEGKRFPMPQFCKAIGWSDKWIKMAARAWEHLETRYEGEIPPEWADMGPTAVFEKVKTTENREAFQAEAEAEAKVEEERLADMTPEEQAEEQERLADNDRDLLLMEVGGKMLAGIKNPAALDRLDGRAAEMGSLRCRDLLLALVLRVDEPHQDRVPRVIESFSSLALDHYLWARKNRKTSGEKTSPAAMEVVDEVTSLIDRATAILRQHPKKISGLNAADPLRKSMWALGHEVKRVFPQYLFDKPKAK